MADDSLLDFDFGADVDASTFEQILEMDEDDDREFSKSLVFGFLEQAETTFASMDQNLKDRNLEELSSLGHFLKGSSATLGFTKVKDECEKIQHFGHKKNETGDEDRDEATSLENIKQSLEKAKQAYDTVQKLMKSFYHES